MAIFGSNHLLAPLLFIGYLIALSWMLTRMRFFSASGLTRQQLILIFLLKSAAGIFYGWLGIYYAKTANMTDTWYFHASSLQEEQLLFSDPVRFFSELYLDPYGDGKWKLLGTENSFWNDLKANALIKGLALLNLITGGHYLVNVLFYNFIGMFGVIGFYKVLADRYQNQRTAVALTCILIPSVLFWTSGIHKEGLLFTALGGVVYTTYFAFQQKHWGLKKILILLVSLLAILIFRNHLLFALLPALMLWFLLERFPKNKTSLSLGLYTAFLLLFFLSPLIHPKANLPQAVVTKQNEFLQLKGNSSLEVDSLQPTAVGFLKNLPQAVDMALTRPHPGNVRHLLSLAAFLEVLLWAGLLLLRLRFPDRTTKWPTASIDYFSIALSISVILIIGFSINNLGAIARYRSVILILLLIPLTAGIDWKKLINLTTYK
jgi:hypothetical protein